MTNKKVRTWLIFFVKLLPLILLIGFMLYFFRHELPVTDDEVVGTSIQYIYYTEDEFNLIDDSDLSNYKFSFDNYKSGAFLFDSAFYSNWTFYYRKGDGGFYYYFIRNDSVDSSMLVLSSTNYYSQVVSRSSRTSFVFVEDFWIKDVIVRDVYNYDHTNYFDNIVKQFDDFTTSNFNFIDSLNFNDFYDFTVEHLVHNPSPIYHSVFNIMIYEIIVDLMLLLFGAFAFVINWSRKWLEGIYEKW